MTGRVWGNESDMIEVERLVRLDGGAQVAVVNRIEGATQNPDRTWSRARLFSGIHTRSKSAGYCRQAADLIPEYARLPALPIFARSGLRARPGRAREIYPC